MNDQHGKSKSASAVDPSREKESSSTASPTEAEIAARAHELWLQEGKPSDSAGRHWLEAERQLKAGSQSRSLIEKVYNHGGSVQN